jgi:hypothetical protein
MRVGNRGTALLGRAAQLVGDIGPMEWTPVGSAACATGVAPYSDVDMLATFLDPARQAMRRERSQGFAAELPSIERTAPIHEDAHTAYEMFAVRVERLGAVPGFGAPIRDFPAVRFPSLTEEPSIELVPGCEAGFLWDDAASAPTSALAALVFPGPDGWLGTNPALHASVLDHSPGGNDYSCRELIRLLKRAKYCCGVPLRSYFVELFALRWIEGSADLKATTVGELLAAMGSAGREAYAETNDLSADLGAAMGGLAEHARAAADSGARLETIDLATPEQIGQTFAFEDSRDETRWAPQLQELAREMATARAEEKAGGVDAALRRWRALLSGPAGA